MFSLCGSYFSYRSKVQKFWLQGTEAEPLQETWHLPSASKENMEIGKSMADLHCLIIGLWDV